MQEDQLHLMGTLRKPYPDGAISIENIAALSDYVYRADRIENGGVNQSELSYPLPLMTWVSEPWQFITHDQITLQLFCAHAYARFGSPVAAVELIVTDGKNRVSQTVGKLSDFVSPVTGYHVPVYQATLDISSLADGLLSADAIIYPHAGNPFQLSVDGEPYPSYHAGVVQKHVQNSDNTLPVRYGYVDATAGKGGAFSGNQATAKQSPFATFNQAVNALAKGGKDAAGAVIVLRGGQEHVIGTQLDRIPIGDYPIRVIPDGERAVVMDSGGRRTEEMPGKIRWEGITFKNQGGSGLFSGTAKDPASFQVFSDCRFEHNDQPEPKKYFSELGVCYFYNSWSNWDQGFIAADRSRYTVFHVVGSSGIANGSVHSSIGSFCNGQLHPYNGSGEALPDHKGDVYAFNVIETHGGNNNIKTDNFKCGPKGLAAVGNIGAITGSESDDNAEFFGSAPETAQNVLWMQNTWAGGSHNGPRHNKGTETQGDIRVFVRGNIFRSRVISGDYSKSKTWTENAPSPRVDNWPSRFGVGESYNFTYDPLRKPSFGFKGFESDVPSWGSVYGKPQQAAFPGFQRDASASGSNDHLEGDYHIVDDTTGKI